jgi:hypothetical protein
MAVLLIDGFDGHSEFNDRRRWTKVGAWAAQHRWQYGRYNPLGTSPDQRDVAGFYANSGFGYGGQTLAFPHKIGDLFWRMDFLNYGITRTPRRVADCAYFRIASGDTNIVQSFVCKWDSGDGRYYYELWTGGTTADKYGNVFAQRDASVDPLTEFETWRSFYADFASGTIGVEDVAVFNGTLGGNQPMIYYRNFGAFVVAYDNCYVTDEADINTGDLGDCRVQLLTPIGNDAISSGITKSDPLLEEWDLVADYWKTGVLRVPTYSEYLVSQSGDAATFTKRYPYEYEDPYAVAVTVAAQAMEGSGGVVIPTLKIGGVTYYADLVNGPYTPDPPSLPWDVVLSPQDADRTSIQFVWNRNPATGLAWTFSDMVSALIGYYQSSGGEVRIFSIYAEILSPKGVPVLIDGYGSKIY